MKITLFCQIRGSLNIILFPNEECKHECKIKSFILKTGDICKIYILIGIKKLINLDNLC